MKVVLFCIGISLMASAFMPHKQKNINNDLARENLKGRVKTVEEKTWYVGYEKQKPVFWNRQTYDVHGNMLKYEDMNDSARTFGSRSYTYNASGYRIERSPDGGSGDRTIYIYDTIGRLSETNRYSPDGHSIQHVFMKYDMYDKLIEEQSLCGDVPNGRTEYKYEKGLLKHEYQYSDFYEGNYGLIRHYVFDTKGDIALLETYNQQQKVMHEDRYRNMVYDYRGNRTGWRVDVKRMKGGPYASVTKRVITYY